MNTARRIVLAAAMAACIGRAEASFVVTFLEDGGDVYAIGVGNLNYSDLVFVGEESGPNFLDSAGGSLLLGPAPAKGARAYSGGITGPATFGTGAFAAVDAGVSYTPDEGGGGIDGAAGLLYVPASYASDDPLTLFAVWTGVTFAKLGLTPGTFTWTWGTSNPDSLTVIVSAVPEPSSLGLLALGALALAGVARRRAA